MSRGTVLVAVLAVLVGGGYVAWDLLGPPDARERLAVLRDTLRARRTAADSCRRELYYEEASFREYDDRVDSLRQRVRGYEALDPEGVPADSYQVYLRAFDRYNEAVPGWEARADSLQAMWRQCRTLTEGHNELADSVRALVTELGLTPDTVLPGDGAGFTPGAGDEPPSVGTPAEAAATTPVGIAAGGGEVVATEEDWRILEDRVSWSRSQRLDTLPVGEGVARLALSLVGTPYVPRTLEVAGPERTVVNLRGLDCVTLVETVLATLDVVRSQPSEVLSDSRRLRSAYLHSLVRIRYRDGILDGYPSRLHYFSDWIRNGEEKGIVRSVTEELDPAHEREPVRYMSSHPAAYPQLARPDHLRAIRAIETRLSARPRAYVPEERIAEVAPRIRTGDVIAATSTLEGLDVAHTGFALWMDGELRLLHAPLVGDSVQVSEEPLAERIRRIEAQDGIMVARPTI